ncbi:VanZ family protein [Rothia sp. P6271]|uniref:VanZ family protein n=1 Tax=Rothia sp. P6271 TaxID=3402659 RepID=UPI003AC2EF36
MFVPSAQRLLYRAAQLSFGLYLLVLGFIVLWPRHIDDNSGGLWLAEFLAHSHEAGWLPSWFTYSTVEWLSNVILFVPGGFLGTLLVRRRYRSYVPLVGFLVTCTIECIQLFLPQRTSSFLDILANTLGASLGWVFAVVTLKYSSYRLRRRA